MADDRMVARHDRLGNAGETRYDWQHDIPLLLRSPGGDRVMAQVLAIVFSAGLDAVLVAMELALETGPPGKVRVEHVVNVLGRLNTVPAPPTAATPLRVATPPLADTARYDSLRADSSVDDTIALAIEGVDLEAWRAGRDQGAAPARHGRRLG